MQDRFAGAERPGNTICATLCDRDKGVDESNFGNHGFNRFKAFRIGVNGSLYGPFKFHGEGISIPFGVFDFSDVLNDPVFPFWSNRFDFICIVHVEGHHDMMVENPLRNGSQGIPSCHGVSGFNHRGKLPFPVRHWFKINTTVQKETALLGQLGERVLQAVENLTQESRAQCHGQKVPRKFDCIADSDTTGHFEYLQVGPIAPYPDYLGLKALGSLRCFELHITHLVHENFPIKFDGDHITANTNDPARILYFRHKNPCRLKHFQ